MLGVPGASGVPVAKGPVCTVSPRTPKTTPPASAPPRTTRTKRTKRTDDAALNWSQDEATAKLPHVITELRAMYGERRWRPHQEPIDELILTILSQQNTDRSTEKSFITLRERFPTWEQVMLAPVEEVADAIRWSGLYRMKAPRIQQVLQRVMDERGNFDLRFLSDLPLDEAKAWLRALPGVGPKTAGIVLLFSLGRPAFAVDTHVFRVTGRLGVISPKLAESAATDVLEAAILATPQGAANPAGTLFEVHINLIAHGRHICHAIKPACSRCRLLPLCPFGQLHTDTPTTIETKGNADA